MNRIHYLVPNFPIFPNRQYEIGALFLQKPWNAIGWTPIYVLPFAIGLAFFTPLDLSFSVWFFYWFWKGVRILGNAVGFYGLPPFPICRRTNNRSLHCYCELFRLGCAPPSKTGLFIKNAGKQLGNSRIRCWIQFPNFLDDACQDVG